MLKTLRPVVILACLLCAAAAQANDDRPPLEEMPQGFQIAFWLNQAAQAFNEGDFADWARATERLHALRPHNQDFMTHLVRAYAQLGDKSRAYNLMLQMQQQGLAQDWNEFDEIEALQSDRLFSHLNGLMIEAGQPFGDAELVAQLDDAKRMPEALAHDPDSGRFFLGTVREGQIFSSSDGQDWTLLASPETHPELMAVMGLAVDSERGHLWVATGALPQFRGFRQADDGRTALVKLDLASGEMLAKHRIIPDGNPRLIGSLAVTADGVVYAADTRTPMIFRLGPDDSHPRPFFTHPNFASLRGLALSGDNSRLYVADYELGIIIVSTGESTQAWKLAVPETLNEAGIDGLYWWDGHLVVIQNGITPQRIMRLKLGEDGLGVAAVAPLVAALPQFDTPTFGVMVDDHLYFLAGSHWHHVDGRGRNRAALPSVALMRTDVNTASQVVVGRHILEQLLQGQQ